MSDVSDLDAKYADIFVAGAYWRHANGDVSTPALEHAYEQHLKGEAAIRCCETGHAPAYRDGRLKGQEDIERASRRAHRAGQQAGAVRALIAVLGLGIAALWLRWKVGR